MAIASILQNLSANLAVKAIQGFIQQRMNQSITDFHNHALSETEYSELECYMEMLVSTWSHAVYSDNEYQEEEEDMVYYFFKYLFIEKDPATNREPLLSDKALLNTKYSIVEIMSMLLKRFKNPFNIPAIVAYARTHDMQHVFYIQALCIISADHVLEEREEQFLNNFAEQLGITKEAKNNLEKEYFKMMN